MKRCRQARRPAVTHQFSQSVRKISSTEFVLLVSASRISELAAFFVDCEAKWKMFLSSTVCRPKETTRGHHFGKSLSIYGLNFCPLLPVGGALKKRKLPSGVAGCLLPSAGDITVFSQETSGDFNFLMCVARWSWERGGGGGKNVNNRMLLHILERNSLDDTSVCL